ncbi:hypothetical protein F6450_18965 [Photobacterium damselae subsp. damselae]|uniref:SAM-dependent MTase RsmB/NOP-type domain-containing protein n=1 Tax=Photobacterium damselae subsp. damselae TaxID=85581 RepID=A0AAD3WSR0_PHODD|nr:hypothetical protein F6450_18965 [Photobacterium damselae subsp. damselae]
MRFIFKMPCNGFGIVLVTP